MKRSPRAVHREQFDGAALDLVDGMGASLNDY
jgi:hypothetical protein